MYDTDGNRSFRLAVRMDLMIDMRRFSAENRIQVNDIISHAIYHWVVKGCPDPGRPSDHGKTYVDEDGQPYLSLPRNGMLRVVQIWLSHDIYTPMIDAISKYRKLYPRNMGHAVFPSKWLNRVVVAYMHDDWRKFDVKPQAVRDNEASPPAPEQSPRSDEP